MRFDIITLFPEMFAAMDHGVIGRAQNKQLFELKLWNPRDYSSDRQRKVDDAPYGGGGGAVMMVEPLKMAIEQVMKEADAAQLIYLTPSGMALNHPMVVQLASQRQLILVAGRYEGFDDRLLKLVPGLELSIGDYVLSGGELAAMVVVDAVARQLAGVVGNQDSVDNDSFVDGLLDYPNYTRPGSIMGCEVPKVLLNGNHREIAKWRRKQSLGRTWIKRPELMTKIELTAEDRMLLNEFIDESKSN